MIGVRRALFTTPCCKTVVGLLLGPGAALPRTWQGVPCTCGRTYSYEADTDSAFYEAGDELPEGYGEDANWWALPGEPVMLRDRCHREDCSRPAVLVGQFYTTDGPVPFAFCKTHIQAIGRVVDTLVEHSIFDSPTP